MLKEHLFQKTSLFFIMMRLNVKVVIIFLLTLGVSVIIVLYSVCGRTDKSWDSLGNANGKSYDLQILEEIDCDINGEYVIGCRKEGDEVYVPFSFLHRYFEIYGKLATYDGLERFEWSHSYSKVYHPKAKYDARGVFMYFENYNVEARERVKCVCGIEGVPVSTQWEVQGYYYPTQIAQFGLSHYSKNLTEPEPRKKIIDDSEHEQANWLISKPANFARVYDKFLNTIIVTFSTGDNNLARVYFKMDHVLYFVMSVDLQLKMNSSFTVTLQNRESKETYNLHYISSDLWITAQVSKKLKHLSFI